jgi:OmpA family/BON domain
MQIDDERSLELLRQIILKDYNEKIEEFESKLYKINHQISDREAKIKAYYPIITDLLERKIINSEDELAKVLSPIMAKAIKEQVSESKDDIIEALYPIMGDAIKRSVSESIKEVYTSINLKIEKALRRGVFSKQIKSKIAGVPTSDLIIQQSFPFNISEIFLIHESSGLLITHVSSAESEMSSDGDLISGMLTAIKDFVSESFKKNGGSQNLYEIQYGDSKIVLERGLYSYLAVVITGQEPINFHNKLSELNSKILSNNQQFLREYEGESIKNKNIEQLLNDFITSYRTITEKMEEYKPTPMLLYLLLTVIAVVLIIFGIIKLPQYFEDNSNEKIIKTKLSLIQDLNVDKIKWSSSGGDIILNGSVNSSNLKKQIDSTISSILTVNNLINNLYVGVKSLPADTILHSLELSLVDYDTSNLTYQIVDDKIIIDGHIESEEEKRRISHTISTLPGIRVVINNIEVRNERQLNFTEIKDLISKSILSFGYLNTNLNSEHKSQLDQIVGYIKNYKNTLLIITACSVGENSLANKAKANERAENVANYLSAKGISSAQYEIKNIILNDSESKMNKNERFVQFELTTRE